MLCDVENVSCTIEHKIAKHSGNSSQTIKASM